MWNENILSTFYFHMKDDGYIPSIKGMLEKDRALYRTIENLYNNKQISEEEYRYISTQLSEVLGGYEINGLMSGINLIIKFRDILKEQGI